MPTVKNKRKLCETSLSDFSIEQISGVPFYNRYREMESVFKKLVPSVDFSIGFAQPYENKAKRVIEWFYIPGNESPSRLSELAKSDTASYSDAIAKREKIVEAIGKAINNAGETERKFLNAALSGIGTVDSDNTTYLCDGHILFGVWGMRSKQGRKIEDIIREDVLDHRVFTISYNVNGEGNLSFSSIGRKYGHKLTPTDVPQVTPAKGWSFTQWEPDIPQGWTVTDDITFTAVCEHTETPVPPISEQPNPIVDDEQIVNNNDDNPKAEPVDIPLEPEFNVNFWSESGGELKGRTHYLKKKGEIIRYDEIPQPIPNKGYVFDGWDHDPINYTVFSNTDFVARFRKIEEEKHGWFWSHYWLGKKGFLHALLNWLLLGLALFLIFLLLWCFVFGKCHFNLCGCDCDNQPAPAEIVDPEPKPNPVQNPCNTEQASGGDEGYMGYFDMGQNTGHFLFEYNTKTQPDRITIYDGKGTTGDILFTYEGGTLGWVSTDVEFHKRMVTVTIEGLEPGTVWNFKINCPEN